MLGQPILHHLLAQGFTVTILTRDSSKTANTLSQQPNAAAYSIAQVDYSSLQSLQAAIKGHDAVVSALARPAQKDEERLIDASIAAGVPRFIPSAFGGDMTVPWVREQPFWADKLQQEAYLLSKVEISGGALSFTMLTNGPIFDFVMQAKLFLNLPERKVTLWDGGDKRLSVTTKDTIGRAVAEALKLPAETKNKNLFIEGAVVSQRQLLELARELTPGEEWTVTEMQSLPLFKAAQEKWSQGVRGPAVGPGFLLRGLFTEGFGGAFDRTDNDLLHIDRMSEKEVKNFLTAYM